MTAHRSVRTRMLLGAALVTVLPVGVGVGVSEPAPTHAVEGPAGVTPVVVPVLPVPTVGPAFVPVVELGPWPPLPAGPIIERKPKPAPVLPPPVPTPIQFVHANLFHGLSPERFTADLRVVTATKPDFITLNEAVRPTNIITPEGYESYRGPHSRFTQETPVLWAVDRWEPVATGTRYLTERRVKWGVRAVNWVTLRNLVTGQTLTIISAHPAPTTRLTQGLLPVFAERLAALVTELSAQGPVLVGGDLNVGYNSRAWPGRTLASAGLVPTYDMFGRPPGGTGDHHGATIDYVLYQPDSGLTPTGQGKHELASDHDAVWATFLLDPPPPVT